MVRINISNINQQIIAKAKKPTKAQLKRRRQARLRKLKKDLLAFSQQEAVTESDNKARIHDEKRAYFTRLDKIETDSRSAKEIEKIKKEFEDYKKASDIRLTKELAKLNAELESYKQTSNTLTDTELKKVEKERDKLLESVKVEQERIKLLKEEKEFFSLMDLQNADILVTNEVANLKQQVEEFKKKVTELESFKQISEIITEEASRKHEEPPVKEPPVKEPPTQKTSDKVQEEILTINDNIFDDMKKKVRNYNTTTIDDIFKSGNEILKEVEREVIVEKPKPDTIYKDIGEVDEVLDKKKADFNKLQDTIEKLDKRRIEMYNKLDNLNEDDNPYFYENELKKANKDLTKNKTKSTKLLNDINAHIARKTGYGSVKALIKKQKKLEKDLIALKRSSSKYKDSKIKEITIKLKNINQQITSNGKSTSDIVDKVINELKIGSGMSDEGMYNDQIDKAMDDDPIYQGTISCDELDKIKPNNTLSFICNTDPSDKPGKHWFAVYINSGPGTRNEVDIFDPLGDPPTKQFLKDLKGLIDRIAPTTLLKLKINRVPNQLDDTSSCGYQSINFLKKIKTMSFADATGYKEVAQDNTKQGEEQSDKLKLKLGFGFI